jgi:hypothetical protein
VQVTARKRDTSCLEVVLFELLGLPATIPQHLRSQLSIKFYSLSAEIGALRDGESLNGFDDEMLSLLVFSQQLLIVSRCLGLLNKAEEVRLVSVLQISSDSLESFSVYLDPALLLGFSAANLCSLLANTLLHLS